MPRPSIQLVTTFIVALLMGVLCGELLRPRPESENSTLVPHGSTLPVILSVEQLVSSSSEQGGEIIYSGTSRFTIRNLSDKAIKIKFPLIGYVYMTNRSGQVLDVPGTGDLGDARTVVVQERSLATFESKFSVWSQDPQKVLEAGGGTQVRYGLDFDVPDDQDPSDWLRGTIISEPAKWTFDLKVK